MIYLRRTEALGAEGEPMVPDRWEREALEPAQAGKAVREATAVVVEWALVAGAFREGRVDSEAEVAEVQAVGALVQEVAETVGQEWPVDPEGVPPAARICPELSAGARRRFP